MLYYLSICITESLKYILFYLNWGKKSKLPELKKEIFFCSKIGRHTTVYSEVWK